MHLVPENSTPPPRTTSWGGPWGARDRSKAEALAETVNAAIGVWEAQRGEPVTPSELSYLITTRLGRSYQITQIRRVRAGERATFDDEFAKILDAWCHAVPTLDRATAFATVGLLPPGMTAAQLRRALAPVRRTRRAVASAHKTPPSDQGKSNTISYVSAAGQRRCAAAPVVSGRRAGSPAA